jgi:hypothetical protein
MVTGRVGAVANRVEARGVVVAVSDRAAQDCAALLGCDLGLAQVIVRRARDREGVQRATGVALARELIGIVEGQGGGDPIAGDGLLPSAPVIAVSDAGRAGRVIGVGDREEVSVIIAGEPVVKAVGVGGKNALAAGANPRPGAGLEPATCCVGVIGASRVGIAFVVQPPAIGIVVPGGVGV